MTVVKDLNLAIETSASMGSVTLGIGDEVLASVELNKMRRHGVDLMPAIDALFARFEYRPTDLGAVYLSIGPGSFTGLRISVAAAKMLGRATGAALYAIPTLDVVVENAERSWERVAVGLNAKRGSMFTGVYGWETERGIWQRELGPELLTPEALLEQVAEPFYLIGDHLPEATWPDRVTLTDALLAIPKSEHLWKIARTRVSEMQPIDPLALEPLYVRLPEAEEKLLNQG